MPFSQAPRFAWSLYLCYNPQHTRSLGSSFREIYPWIQRGRFRVYFLFANFRKSIRLQ